MQKNRPAIQPQTEQLSPELVPQLIELLKNPKLEVKYGTLNTILQYTKSEEAKKMFQNTQLFVEINKVLNEEKLTKICLSTLIHFSSLPGEIVEKEFVRFVEPLIFNLKDWKNDLRQQLSLLCLLNISKYDAIIEQLVNKQDKKGFLLQVLYGFMEIKPSRRWVVTNVFVNVSSNEIGRQYVTEEKIYARFLDYINCENQATRVGVLKLLRNCAFHWEQQSFISQFLKPQYDVLNRTAEHILYLLQKAELCHQNSQGQILKIHTQYEPNQEKIKKTLKEMKVSSNEKALAEITLVIDIILVLSNSNFAQRKPSIKQQPLKELIGLLKFTGLSEQYKDKLEALEIFCFY